MIANFRFKILAAKRSLKQEERNIMYSTKTSKAKYKRIIQIGTEKQILGIIHPE